MKKALVLFLGLQLVMPGLVYAETLEDKNQESDKQEYEYRLRSDIWPHLIIQPVYAFLHLNIHEGSHALTAKALGYDIEAYRPYPHFIYIDGERNFVLGMTITKGETTSGNMALIAVMPTITDVALFSAADITLSYMNSDSAAAPFLFFGGMVWPWIDFVTAFNSPAPTTDVALWSKELHLNRAGVVLLGDIVAALGLWRVIHHGQQAFFEKVPKRNQKSVSMMPLVSNGYVTLSLVGSF